MENTTGAIIVLDTLILKLEEKKLEKAKSI